MRENQPSQMGRFLRRFREGPLRSVLPSLAREVALRLGVWLRRAARANRRARAFTLQAPLATGQPIAAVVIPCFNYGSYILEAVQSALAQTLRNVDIIVVDDGSTDPLTQEALENVRGMERVRVLRKTNGGLSSARNAGIAATSAWYISCLDADDRMDQTYLEKAVTLLEVRQEAAIAYPLVTLFGSETGLWRTQELDPALLLERNVIPAATVFRRSVWEKVGAFDETMLSGCEDWDFWLRVAALGYWGLLIHEPLIQHRRHDRNMTDIARVRHSELAAQVRRHAKQVLEAPRRPPIWASPETAFRNVSTTTQTEVIFAAAGPLAKTPVDSPGVPHCVGLMSRVPPTTIQSWKSLGWTVYPLRAFLPEMYHPAWLGRFECIMTKMGS